MRAMLRQSRSRLLLDLSHTLLYGAGNRYWRKLETEARPVITRYESQMLAENARVCISRTSLRSYPLVFEPSDERISYRDEISRLLLRYSSSSPIEN